MIKLQSFASVCFLHLRQLWTFSHFTTVETRRKIVIFGGRCNVLHLLGQSGCFIGVKFAHSVIKAGESVPELSQALSIQNTVQLLWVATLFARFKVTDDTLTKEWLSGNHLSYWNLVSGYRQSKVWIKQPCLKLARFLRNLPKTKLSVLIGLLTEHDRLNKHLHMMGLLSDPTCAACGIQEESALHFICECSTLANLKTHR
jgi:hypothetical protein